MTLKQFLIALFVALVVGLVLPVSSGVRTALFVALVAFTALLLIGGGTQYLISLFD
jgi:uncharacterized membrane protein YccC